MSATEGQKTTIYFSIEEGWIHYILVAPGTDVGQRSIPCTSEIVPYSEAQMRYLRARATTDPDIRIYQARRDNP